MPVRTRPARGAPALSVVMPVHNALPHLDAAIESILRQSHRDFEFVILDDASNDGSGERLRQWAARDPRIRLLESSTKLGPALSSQRVAAAAAAPVVARMDGDDISHPERLREELAAFDRHPEAGVVACLCDFIDTEDRKLRGSERWRLARESAFVPFAHGAMMYRRTVFDQAGGYRAECELWEDQDLVTRMAKVAQVLVIPRSLYSVRLSATSTRAASDSAKLEHAVDMMYRSTERLGKHQGYDDLLRPGGDADGKVDPRVFISLGSQLLWAGGKPHMFRRLLRRGKLRLNWRTIAALTWTAWASASPTTFRKVLQLRVAAKNRLASPEKLSDGAIVWRHP